MKSRFGIIYILFLFSGISGLVYEVVWTRMLTYLFGATIYAITTVLASFMGGLALGSFSFGKIADQSKKNLRLYGLLEIGIGVSAFLLPYGLKLLHPIYKYVYSNFEASFMILSLMRFALTFLFLLIPTTLMGGTLPILSRFVARKRESLGLNIGWLYALNTTGAVVGCFISGFYLIATFGISGAVYISVVINIVIGVAAVLLSKNLDTISEIEIPAKELKEEIIKDTVISKSENKIYPRNVLRAVLIAYFISGFVSLAYQVIWSRALVFTFDTLKNTPYSFTAMLTVFLIGLALGSAISSRIIDHFKDPLRFFGLLQILIGLLGEISFFIIFSGAFNLQVFPEFNDKNEIYWSKAVFNVFAKTAVSIFFPTFLMGMGFPVAARISVQAIKDVGKSIGNLYSFNTVGAILGSFLAGFFIIPKFGIAFGITILATINVLTGIIILFMNPFLKAGTKKMIAVIGVVIVLVLAVRVPRNVKFQDLTETETLFFYEEGPLATVSIVGNSLGYRLLNVDNVGVAGTDPIMLTDQKSLAHYPMLLLKNPKNVLTVGFGSGGASYSYTLYSSLQNIHCVEICDTVLHSAPYLEVSNKGLLEKLQTNPDSRYKIIFDDVRSYLNFTKMRYDVIATDCTDLRYKTNANLYDLQYFQICRKRINDDGMVCVWMPLSGLSDEAFKVALRTFYRVFENMSIWYINNTPTHYILLIGTPKPLKIDYSLLVERLKDKKIYDDLAEINLNDPDKILSCFITDQSRLENFLKGNIINTENFPYLEFQSPKYGYGDKPLIDNLNSLLSLQIPITKYLVNMADKKDEILNNLDKYFEALQYIIKGHAEYRLVKLYEACDYYLKSSEIQPNDPSIKHLLDFPEIKLRKKSRPWEIWSRWILGELYFKQKRWVDAVTNYAEILRMDEEVKPDLRKEILKWKKRAALKIADCYEYTGQIQNADIYRKKAEEFKE